MFVEKSDEELKSLSDDELFAYLDAKAEWLRKTNIVKPLGTYHTKHFAAFTKGGALTDEELKTAKKLGKEGDIAYMENIQKMSEELGGDPKLKDPGIKNIKTNRSQWFD